MRQTLRLSLAACLILLIALFFLTRKVLDTWDQYSISSYIRASINHGAQAEAPTIPGEPGDKIVVMAKLEQEDTNWVEEYLPE